MVLVEIDPRKMYKSFVKKLEPLNEFISEKENQRRILRFQVGLIIGMQIWFWTNTTFQIIEFISGTLVGVSIAIILFFFKLLGVEEIGENLLGTLLEFIDNMSEVEHSFDLLPAIGDAAASIIELITEITRVLTRFGRAIFANFTILFPILEDIKIDIDWLHVSFPYLVRTLFNIIQFFAVYYFYRKIKARLRARIKDEIKMKKYVFFGE